MPADFVRGSFRTVRPRTHSREIALIRGGRGLESDQIRLATFVTPNPAEIR